MFRRYLVFCWWLWGLSILYYLRKIKYSFFYLSFGAVIFTIFNFLNNNNIHYTRRLIIGIIEVIILILNTYYHFIVNKLPLYSKPDIIFNLCLFIFYLIILHIFGESFYSIYYNKVLNEHENQRTLFEYLYDSKIFKYINNINII
mgnify:CR=1 FL=1